MNRKLFLKFIIFGTFMFNPINITFAQNNNLLNASPTIDDDSNIIKNINFLTSGNELIANLHFDSQIELRHGNDKISSDRVLSTGDIIKYNNNEYKLSVRGDVLGTGELSRNNAKKIAKHIIKKNILSGDEYLLAADYNNDSKIKMNDVVSILRDIKNDIKKYKEIPEIKYTKSNTGKFVFINNPETIWSQHLADEDFADTDLAGTGKTAGHRLIYKDKFSGDMDLYYEHIAHRRNDTIINGIGNGLGESIYYLIRFYNHTDKTITLTINKSGNSTLHSNGTIKYNTFGNIEYTNFNKKLWTNTWQEYYHSKPQTFSIAAGKTLILYHPDCTDSEDCNVGTSINNFQFSTEATPLLLAASFDGALNMSSTGELDFEVLACKNLTKCSSATYPGSDDDIATIFSSGYVNHSPDVYNNSTFYIDDSIKTGENLKVKINNNIYDNWATNTIGLSLASNGDIIKTVENAYVEETVNLNIKPERSKPEYLEEPEYFTIGNPGETDRRKAFIDSRKAINDFFTTYKNRPNVYEIPYSFANWAVRYHENITIKNAGTRSRTISFVVKTPNKKSVNIIPDINYDVIFNETYDYTTGATKKNPMEIEAWSVEIGPGETKKIPTIVILGGMSSGDYGKMLKVVD